MTAPALRAGTASAATRRSPGATQGWTELHLGTRVEIACDAATPAAARAAIEAAFTEVARIHRLMSFHEADSDVSRLNRDAARGAVRVDPRTVRVLRAACELSRVSDGHFDVTVAPELVRAGHLPRPAAACAPAGDASWRDIEIVADDAVLFRRPLWLDLGGIAKGFAVDRAFAVCSDAMVDHCLVNAGGDVRVSAGTTGWVHLDVPGVDAARAGCVELSGGSIGSSCGWPHTRKSGRGGAGPHFDGVSRASADPMRFVSVLAEECMRADALTKVVLLLGDAAVPVLNRYHATALVHECDSGWRQFPLEPRR